MRQHAFGEQGTTIIDRLGVYLSRRAILRQVGRRPGLRVLDLGCGYHAAHLRALLPFLAEGVGVDVRVDQSGNDAERIQLVESTVEAAVCQLESNHFDLVLLISVLEHLWDPEHVLRECQRVLLAGGALLVNVPTWCGKIFLEFSAFRLHTSPYEEMDDHKMYYGKRDLWPLLVRAGFKPSRIQLRYHKFGLNLFARAAKEGTDGKRA